MPATRGEIFRDCDDKSLSGSSHDELVDTLLVNTSKKKLFCLIAAAESVAWLK